MFQKNLTDLIRGIRSHKNNPDKFVLQQLEDLRNELKSTDLNVKTIALSKLNYLQMFGHQTHWASFHIVEVMASPNLSQKRIGYLSASSTFRQDTEVLMLTMNLVKKDLLAPNYFEVGMALGGLAQFMTPDLAQFLVQDLLTLLNHSRPYVRKRAVLTLYPLFLKFPQGLRLGFPRLKEKLEDTDPAVVSSAVNVICELARKNPENFLGLAPQFYHLLTNSGNNWMVIKVVKLLGALTPLEPRLAKKLMVPLRNLIETTPAMSLLYECIHTVISGGLLHPSLGDAAKELANLCSVRLKLFLEDKDQNLKYIGLVALEGLLTIYPDLSTDHNSLVIACLDDFDYSVRIRALSLVKVMGRKEYLVEVFKRLMNQLGDVQGHETTTVSAQNSEDIVFVMTDNYRKMVVDSILTMGAKDTYNNIPNFEWYLAVLVDLVYLAGVDVGDQLSYQFLDVSVRVKSIRSNSVKFATRLLQDTSLLDKIDSPGTNIKILFAAAWVCGEYNEHLMNPEIILTYLFRPQTPRLPFDVQSAYLQAALKIYYRFATELDWTSSDASFNEFQKVTNNLLKSLEPLITSIDVEVQERACNLVEILKVIQFYIAQSPTMADKFLSELSSLFQTYELNAVAPKAQSKVPTPEDLDLDAWIHSPPPKPKAKTTNAFAKVDAQKSHKQFQSESTPIANSPKNTEDAEKRNLLRKKRMQNDPFYIDDRTYFDDKDDSDKLLPDVDSIPIVKLSEDDIQVTSHGRRLESSLYQTPTSPKTKKKGKKKVQEPKVEIDQGEMPDGALDSDGESNLTKIKVKKDGNKSTVKDLLDIDTSSLSNVDLTTPLNEDEQLPSVKAYLTPDQHRQQQEALYREQQKPKSKKDSKDKKKKKKKVKSSDKQQSGAGSIDLNDLDPIMSSEKKTRKKKSKRPELDIMTSVDDDNREEIKAFADPQLIEVTNAVVGTPHLEETILSPQTSSPILDSKLGGKAPGLPFEVKQVPFTMQAINTELINMEVNFEYKEKSAN
ncbi:Adaptor protein complex AP-3 delta subunit [Conidiobolus coronatus NRRL 28638]|uniref:AP-3 complex subunit delta n=1 Tax=Conidiobolus coronatus (strain ATCC 28846 / CBS 209.66 / NRRL 28638) TaxID=796925 RepID=A0A137P149_CONC2|nr:Adaptor protein complex AP-3 delta subunit [Conidiobolus coronatus NRRL 28638]|eukprot:KXN68785.1 Adaptor protein complex AP-3 delta subunit [Conidiobolus coronatus NRRL 28638]